MKRQIRKLTMPLLLFGSLLCSVTGSAQTQINVYPGTKVYLCQGITYGVNLKLGSLDCGTDFTSQQSEFVWNKQRGPGSFNTGTYNIAYNYFTITMWGDVGDSVLVNANCNCGSCNNASFWINFQSYSGTITGSAIVCSNPWGTYPYTVTTNNPSPSYSWTPPSNIMTPSGSQAGATVNENTIANTSGTGTLTCNITSSNGCPMGNASNTATFSITSSNAGPPEPSSVHYIQETNQCYFNPYVSAISGASTYQWCMNNSFSPPADEQTVPRSILEFMPNTRVTIYVRATNGCGPGAIRTTTMNTPVQPPGCVWRVRADGTNVKAIKEVSVYPNPAGNSFKIDLPGTGNTVNIKILNIDGSIIRSFSTSESTLEVETSNMPAGLYIIQLNSTDYDVVKKIQILK